MSTCCYSWLFERRPASTPSLHVGDGESETGTNLIPFSPSFSERRVAERSHNSHSTPMVVISDPGQDLDDEMSYIMMRYLVDEGVIDLRGVVTTLAPAHDRARLCRGTLNLLGLHRVPVGVGTDGGDIDGKHTAAPFEAGARSYMPSFDSEEGMRVVPSRRLINRLYTEALPQSLTLLIIASLKDAALFLRDNEKLFVAKTKEVVIMGGVLPPADGRDTFEEWTPLVPDTSHNQDFDSASTKYFFRRCQELGVSLVVVSRFAAYVAKMSRGVYDKLALSGSSIGQRLRSAQRDSIEQLWSRAACPIGDPKRKGLPTRCDAQWFIDTFCGGQNHSGRGADEPVWDLVDGFMQYDSIALLAAIPKYRERFFVPVSVKVRTEVGTICTHHIIGYRTDRPGVKEPVSSLVEFLEVGFVRGIQLCHHFKTQVVIVTQLQQDGVIDMALTALMLRTLFQLDLVHCIGIVALIGGENFFGGVNQVDVIRKVLCKIGLPFVPVLDAMDNQTAVDHLKRLYSNALPVGVALVATDTLTVACAFVESYPQLFHEKTCRVVHMVSARQPLCMSGNSGDGLALSGHMCWLQPDPELQNNLSDMQAATRFYDLAQELSVPMVILNRFAAKAAKIPKSLFDTLATYGGDVGKFVCETQKASMQDLFRQVCEPSGSARRGRLPTACDRQWFERTFCSGEITAEDDIWSRASFITVSAPLALLAALPGVVKRFLNATPIEVRAATHSLVGWCSDDRDLDLQKVIVQSLLYAARCELSEFGGEGVPPLSLGSSQLILDMSEEALSNMLPHLGADSFQ